MSDQDQAPPTKDEWMQVAARRYNIRMSAPETEPEAAAFEAVASRYGVQLPPRDRRQGDTRPTVSLIGAPGNWPSE